MRGIIFDFYRTIFNPETQKLVPGAQKILQRFRKRGFRLVLISRREKGRMAEITKCEIAPLFDEIYLVRKKNVAVLKRVLRSHRVDPKSTFVVGDRVQEEIALGNSVGCKTVWLRQGKFANEKPCNKSETPNATIRRLNQLLDVIR